METYELIFQAGLCAFLLRTCQLCMTPTETNEIRSKDMFNVPGSAVPGTLCDKSRLSHNFRSTGSHGFGYMVFWHFYQQVGALKINARTQVIMSVFESSPQFVGAFDSHRFQTSQAGVAIAGHYSECVRLLAERVPVLIPTVNCTPKSSVDVTRVTGKSDKLVAVSRTGLERETRNRRQGKLTARG